MKLRLFLLGLALLLPATSYAATSTTLQSAAVADGVGTAASVFDYGELALQVTITGKASVNFEGSANSGTTYSAIVCRRGGSTAGDVSTTNASGLFFCNATGITNIRTPVIGWQTGTVTVVASVQGDTSGGVGTSLTTLLSGEDQTNNLLMTSGGVVRSTTMASAVTTDTTSSAVALPVGSKSIYGSVAGTGAVTQTQAIWSGLTSGFTPTVAGGGVLLCTLTLSGTTFVGDQCPVITAAGLFYKVVSTNTTGTSASGTVTAMY